MKIFDLLEDACHQLDLQLAYTYTEESSSSSSFTKYAEELHKLQVAKAKLTEAQDAMATLEEAITYIAIAHGVDSPGDHRVPYAAGRRHEAICGKDGRQQCY